jgi:hypothetical protein
MSRFWSLHLVAVALFFSASARAHDLVVDQLSLRMVEDGKFLSGQALLDPELTGSRSPEDEKSARVLAFVDREIGVHVDAQRVHCEWSIRELWSRDGAVPADLVVFRCPLDAPPRAVSIQLGPEIPALVVSIETSNPLGHVQSHSVLLRAGRQSGPFNFHQPSAGWLKGGQELFPVNPANSEAHSPAAQTESNPATAIQVSPADGRHQDSIASRESSPFSTAWDYLVLGVQHIIPKGWDHVLFVLALTLGTRSFRLLLLELAAFTVAHTMTLALGAIGWVSLPARVIEPLIAFSIALAGANNLWGHQRRSTAVGLVFALGLLHGLGFALVLREFALPPGDFLVALLSFNVGVELGQVAVVLLVGGVLLAFRSHPEAEVRVRRGGSWVPLLFGLWWTIQRIL